MKHNTVAMMSNQNKDPVLVVSEKKTVLVA